MSQEYIFVGLKKSLKIITERTEYGKKVKLKQTQEKNYHR